MIVTQDRSIERDGRVLFFSLPRFIEQVCTGHCCFVCGALIGSRVFNDEHVLPRWLLKRFNLFNRNITLPNGVQRKYGQHRVPCCQECNTELGQHFEEPIQRVIDKGTTEVARYLKQGGASLFHQWLSLIFFKTHYRDRDVGLFLDKRKGHETIGDLYDWESLHHVHCVSRAFHSGAEVSPNAIGSLLLFRITTPEWIEPFDYGDLYAAKTLLLRINDVGLLAVLDDTGLAVRLLQGTLERLEGPLSPIQLREVMAQLAVINLKLRERPRFRTEVAEERGVRICASSPPEAEMEPAQLEYYGSILDRACGDFVKDDDIREQVLAGRYTFLFDEEGKFIRNSMILRGQQKNVPPRQ